MVIEPVGSWGQEAESVREKRREEREPEVTTSTELEVKWPHFTLDFGVASLPNQHEPVHVAIFLQDGGQL